VATRVIGLDIGTTQIRAAEVEVSGGVGTLVNYATAPVPAGAVGDGEVLETTSIASALKQLWASAKFSNKNVAIGVGNQRVVVREIDVPELPMADLRRSLAFQVQDLLPMSTDEALLDFYPTSQVPGENGASALRGILVAAGKAMVSNTVLAVESAGLTPALVDLNAFAILRAQLTPQWSQQTVAFVEIGARTTNVIISQGGMPRFIRTLAAGGHDVTMAVSSVLSVPSSEAEAIKREVGVNMPVAEHRKAAADAVLATTKSQVDAIRNTFVYYAGNNPGAGIQHVVLTGGGALLPGFGQYLASASRLPASFGSGMSRVRAGKRVTPQMLQGQEALMANVIGLAMSEVA